MANSIDAGGLTLQTLPEIISEILNGTSAYPGMFAIYGADINVQPNSPDGQMVNIIAQAKIDVLEFIQQIYNSFDPDEAVGVQLDMRCAINGVQRQGATRTQQMVSVTTDQAVTLPGKDTDNPFTVADGSGNKFELVTSFAFGSASTESLLFEAEQLGPVITVPNTITNIDTVTLGVTSVNNPLPVTAVGQAQETDAALRIRRAKSVTLPSKGFWQGLVAALLSIDDVEQAIVLENNTDSTDGDGIPSHSIWVIVNGGADADIAQAIYVKRNAGCGMKGAVTVDIQQTPTQTVEIKFDRPIAEDLWISFDVVPITGSIDVEYLRAQILANITYDINQPADTARIVKYVKTIFENASVSNEGVSDDDISYVPLLSTSTKQHQFALAAERILINGSGPVS